MEIFFFLLRKNLIRSLYVQYILIFWHLTWQTHRQSRNKLAQSSACYLHSGYKNVGSRRQEGRKMLGCHTGASVVRRV